MTMTTAYINATVFPVHEPGADPFRGYLETKAGVITAVGVGDHPGGARVVDLDGALVLPGFVSAHSHLWQSAFRGLADGCGTFAWIERLHKRFGPLLTDGDMYAFTAFGHDELLRNGITTVCNHTHDFGGGPDEQWQAALDSPQHTVYSFSSTRSASPAERLSDIEKFAALAADTRDAMFGLSVNTTGLMAVTDMRAEADLLRDLGFGQHAHLLEDPGVAADQQASWDDLVSAGRVDHNTILAHFIHTTDKIRSDAARLGVSMVWNPLSNGRLGSGIPDIAGYLADGIRVGLGVDGQASADVADPFQNMRTGLYLVRAFAQSASVMSARDILRLHTIGSAQVLGVDDRVGSLEVGKRADFVALKPAHPVRDADPTDLWALAVLSLSASDITGVYVDGTRVSCGVHERNPDLVHDVGDRVARLYQNI